MSDAAAASALDQLRLEGALFFRSELTEPFEFESTPLALADALVPGADRLILFHIVAVGLVLGRRRRRRALLGGGGRRHRDALRRPLRDGRRGTGAVRVDPRRCSTRCRGRSCRCCATAVAGAAPRSCAATCTRPTRCSTRRCGRCRRCSSCGCPTARPPAGCGRASTTRSPTRHRRRTCRSSPIATRLPELVLIEVLRVHLATAPAIDHGWIAALHDPGPGAGARRAAPGPGPPLDGRRAGQPRRRVPLVARRPLPPGARPVADPLPHGVAHAPRQRAARHHRAVGVHHRPARRLRLRGSVQPGVQARARRLAEPLAGGGRDANDVPPRPPRHPTGGSCQAASSRRCPQAVCSS